MAEPSIHELINILHEEDLIRLVRRAQKKGKHELSLFLYNMLKDRYPCPHLPAK